MMDMMLTGRLLSAAEGLQEKVIRYVTPAGEALAKAKELAHRISKNSVETNWMIVNVLPRIHDMTHNDGLFVEQLNSARARPPEAEARLREFVEGKAKKIQDNQA
jgi:enoyl-CoA hydratase/carnithine racemase